VDDEREDLLSVVDSAFAFLGNGTLIMKLMYYQKRSELREMAMCLSIALQVEVDLPL
jgi:hypothetical protein